ncbi:MAG: hypothetical protein K0S54_189 [Alphaproteobacteria bacterium]|jgi:hypothetical protein|nr:hypothetical protein [Alphaproteobacteria bacterium]
MAVLLTVIVLTTLMMLFSDWIGFRLLIGAAYLLFVAVAMLVANRRDFYFTGAALVLSLLVLVVKPEPWPIVAKAILLAAYFSTFLLALNMLRDAARTSAAVRRCGNYVIAQPPGRRYAALTAAAHLFAIILNYGVVNLLGTMVKRSNTLASAGGDMRRYKIREQRMMLAVMRGQCTMVGWSPLSILIALTLALIPGLTWGALAPAGATFSLLFLALGWVMDRAQWRTPQGVSVQMPVARHGFAESVLPMLAVLLGIMVLVVGASKALNLTTVDSIMLMMPVFAMLWIGVQFRHLGPRLMPAMVSRRVARWPMGEFASSRSETLILSNAAYIGSVLAALVPEDAIENLIVRFDLPWLGLAIALAFIIAAVGQLGVNSLVMLTLIGSSLHHMPADGLPSVLLATALLGGSALSIASSPYGTPVVLVGGLTGETPEKIGRVWNGPFTVAAFGVLCLYLAALDWWRP